MVEVWRVKIPGRKHVHLTRKGSHVTVCGCCHTVADAPFPEEATGEVTCERCLRWAVKWGVSGEMDWLRRVRVTLARWLRALAGWVGP